MIRKINSNDLDEFRIIVKEYKDNYYELYNINNILDNKYQQIFIYKQANKIIGFIHIEKLYETLSILHVFISKEYRNQNKATLLMDYVLSNPDIENVILEVNVNNKPAINLYQKLGFNIINTRKGYYNGEDAYIMEKKVQNENN